jgi:hypothetical protein
MHFTIDTDLAIACILIGILALVMAVPPLLQMFYGRPRLEFTTDEFTGPDGKLLLVAIKNKKTENRLLRNLGVQREIGDVLAYLDIQEQGSGRFIAKDVSAKLSAAATRQEGLLVRAHPLFTIGVIVISQRGSAAGIVDARANELRPISEGDYLAQATIVCGEQIHKIERSFKIGKAEHLTIWV